MIQARCFGLTISVWKALEGISHIIFPKRSQKNGKMKKKWSNAHFTIINDVFSKKLATILPFYKNVCFNYSNCALIMRNSLLSISLFYYYNDKIQINKLLEKQYYTCVRTLVKRISWTSGASYYIFDIRNNVEDIENCNRFTRWYIARVHLEFNTFVLKNDTKNPKKERCSHHQLSKTFSCSFV